MKKAKVIEILILLFVFSCLMTGILLIRHYKYIKPNTYRIVFKDIDSIVKGSPVRFMGINIGHVIKLKRKDKYIIVAIRITKKGVKIPDYTRAKVAFNGLGGSKSIELLPPDRNDSEIRGIVASESLRLNDLSKVVRDLKDVAIVINNFVQELDPDILMTGIKEYTNPEMINKLDSDMEKFIIEQQNLSKKRTKLTDMEDNISGKLEKTNKSVQKIFPSFFQNTIIIENSLNPKMEE